MDTTRCTATTPQGTGRCTREAGHVKRHNYTYADVAPVAVPAFQVGQRVGIVSGLQAVGGPTVTAYGTVVREVTYWENTPEYVVHLDNGGEDLVYRPYLLRAVAPTDVSAYFREANVARAQVAERAVDTSSSASRQHYIDTGEYLREGESLSPVDMPAYVDVAEFEAYNVQRTYRVASGMRDVWATEDSHDGIARQANGTARRAVRESTGEVLSTWDVAQTPVVRDVWQDRETDRLDAQDARTWDVPYPSSRCTWCGAGTHTASECIN